MPKDETSALASPQTSRKATRQRIPAVHNCALFEADIPTKLSTICCDKSARGTPQRQNISVYGSTDIPPILCAMRLGSVLGAALTLCALIVFATELDIDQDVHGAAVDSEQKQHLQQAVGLGEEALAELGNAEKALQGKEGTEKASPGPDKASPEKKAELGEEEKARSGFIKGLVARIKAARIKAARVRAARVRAAR